MTENHIHHTLSKKEMHRVAAERIHEISKEFVEGFHLLENYPKSVTMFGSNRVTEDSPYYKSARTLSSRIVKELGYSILSGGGPGIMEASNRGAYEAGGDSIGLLIKLPQEQAVNKYITKAVPLYYFFVRKVCLSFAAEAYIFFPGGFGTLDEFFEILTLVQTKKIENVPLICVGTEFWNPLKELMKNQLLSQDTIVDEDLDLFKITDDHDEIIDIIRKAQVHIEIPFDKDKVNGN